jgi:hypothetical protein
MSIWTAKPAILSPTRWWRAALPFLFATGYGDLGERTDLLGRPMLRKPYLASELAAAFADLLPAKPLGAAA